MNIKLENFDLTNEYDLININDYFLTNKNNFNNGSICKVKKISGFKVFLIDKKGNSFILSFRELRKNYFKINFKLKFK